MEAEKAIEFLLNQQVKSDLRLERLETDLNKVIGVLESLTDFRVDGGFLLRKLAEGHAKTEENLALLATRMSALSESQKHTDDRLNALIRIRAGSSRATSWTVE